MARRWSVCGTAEVVLKPRFLWPWPSAHLYFLVSCFSFSSWQYSRDSLGFRSGEFAGQSSTPTPWSYSTLWTASFFGNECLWLILLVKGVNDCLLDNSQISSLPHDCVAQWSKLRDHFEDSGNLCRCFELINWLTCHHIIICWDSKLVSFC